MIIIIGKYVKANAIDPVMGVTYTTVL